MIQQLITKLAQLYYDGIIEDLIIFKGGYPGISIKSISSVDELLNCILNMDYHYVTVKIPDKIRYEKEIYLPEINNIRINRKSIVVEYIPKHNGTITVKRPNTKIKWY